MSEKRYWESSTRLYVMTLPDRTFFATELAEAGRFDRNENRQMSEPLNAYACQEIVPFGTQQIRGSMPQVFCQYVFGGEHLQSLSRKRCEQYPTLCLPSQN